MQTIEELAEQVEAALPADVHDKEITVPNGARVRLVRTRRPGKYCATCAQDLALVGHQAGCPELTIERHNALPNGGRLR
jgi:hypothetical protein